MPKRQDKKKTIQRIIYPIMLLIGFLMGCGVQYETHGSASETCTSDTGKRISARFSPTRKKEMEKGCTQMILDVIGRTKSTLHIGIFALTSPSIIQALQEAYKRGVKVAIITHKTFAGKNSRMPELADAGIQIYVYRGSHTYHHKFLVSDKKIFTTGSFNHSKAAESTNRENCCLNEDETLALRYYEKWEEARKSPKFYPYGDLNAGRS